MLLGIVSVHFRRFAVSLNAKLLTAILVDTFYQN